VHRGHAALIRRCRERAGRAGRVVALAFDPHPVSVLRPAQAPPRLTRFEDRKQLLIAAGADDVERLDPAEVLSISAHEFLRRVCAARTPKFVIAGEDFRFGQGREGDVAYLARAAGKFGFQTEVLPPVEVGLGDDLIVRASSTMVRWLVRHGRVDDAERVLGRPYAVSGVVNPGDQRGRAIGFPTANLSTTLLLPADGVYACRAILPDGSRLPAAANVGTRPTVSGVDRRLEVHVIDPQSAQPADLARHGVTGEYHWELRLEFVAWVRDQVRFTSFQALAAQLPRDVRRCLGHLRVSQHAGRQEPSVGTSGIAASGGLMTR
jgi:riboflavin kinase / FMN adenylyltransferase